MGPTRQRHCATALPVLVTAPFVRGKPAARAGIWALALGAGRGAAGSQPPGPEGRAFHWRMKGRWLLLPGFGNPGPTHQGVPRHGQDAEDHAMPVSPASWK